MSRKSMIVGVLAFGLAVAGVLGALSASAVPAGGEGGSQGKDQLTRGQGGDAPPGNEWLAGNEWSVGPLGNDQL